VTLTVEPLRGRSNDMKQGKEISFRPEDDFSSGANFNYSMRGKMITIAGSQPGKGSFVEEIEKALRKITHWHQAPITSFRIFYRDADGMGGEIRWDGQHAEILAPP
jgi:23S rRNA G2069 N7-methylase RlmK/C1962 C5-methylase RlmI